ncbi:MAG: hypothetical protein R6T83_03835 [Salinibacter sp.]
MVSTRFRRRRRSPSASPAPTGQEKRKAQAQHIRALERVLGGSVGWGFDTLSRQLSRMRRDASR